MISFWPYWQRYVCFRRWVGITPYKRQWQAIRGMWGKRATKVMAEPFIGDSLSRKPLIGESLVGKPFTFSDLACFYPWCQVTFFGWQNNVEMRGLINF